MLEGKRSYEVVAERLFMNLEPSATSERSKQIRAVELMYVLQFSCDLPGDFAQRVADQLERTAHGWSIGNRMRAYMGIVEDTVAKLRSHA